MDKGSPVGKYTHSCGILIQSLTEEIERERVCESLTLPRSFICHFDHTTQWSLKVLFEGKGCNSYTSGFFCSKI